jgi:nucleolar GTP-binding protein
MLKKIPIILTSDKLLDKSFKKIKKIVIMDRNAFYKNKKTIIAKTESFSSIIISTLESYVKEFPSINQLPEFHQEMIQIKLDTNKLKKALGAVDWARKTCQMIYSKQKTQLSKSQKIDFLKQKQKEIQGRISSVVKQIDKELKILADAQLFLNQLPDIQDIPTVVIAGYPNVGKSSLLRCLSSAKPEVAQYPFTTKQIYVGHILIKEKYILKRFQIIDTPGLLDRPIEKRNKIEKQAIAALKHLADIIVFILDPTETCGYSIKDQKHLLLELKKMFKESVFIIVENKSDIKKTKSGNIKISSTNKKNINILIDKIFENYPE